MYLITNAPPLSHLFHVSFLPPTQDSHANLKPTPIPADFLPWVQAKLYAVDK